MPAVPHAGDGGADAGTEAAIPEGSRNQTLHRFAVKTLMQQRDTEAARRSFRREAEKYVPPLAEEELERIWRSAGKYARIARSQPEAAAQKAVSPVRPPEWEEPIPLDGPELMPFPVEALPKAVAGYVLALSESLQVPPDMAAVIAVSLSSLCAKRQSASPKREAKLSPSGVSAPVFGSNGPTPW